MQRAKRNGSVMNVKRTMKVRIVYTYEMSKEDFSKLRKFLSIGRIRDLVFGCFVIGGRYGVNQEIWNQITEAERDK